MPIKEKKFCHRVLAEQLGKYPDLDRRERAFAVRLCEGVVERMLTLDFLIARLSVLSPPYHSRNRSVSHKGTEYSTDSRSSAGISFVISDKLSGRRTAVRRTPFTKPATGDYVIDCCAAPGGKALQAADLLVCGCPEAQEESGLVSARDISEYKLSRIRENLSRCGFRNAGFTYSAAVRSICRCSLISSESPSGEA